MALPIQKIITVHYFEYAKDYVFEGERHDFWELLYVDKGEVEVMAGDVGYRLRQGEIIFHKPNEFHNVFANGVVAPNLVVVSFECSAPAMAYFEGKILAAGEDERTLLARIVREARDAFSTPLDDPRTQRMERASSHAFGSEQMIAILLQEMLIRLIRRGANQAQGVKISSSVKLRSDNDLVKRVIAFMEENAAGSLTFAQVCRFSAQSATNLKTIFKAVTGYGVMEYYRMIKIDLAKTMLREGNGNITQIADRLGYASVHYFSRYFKQATGMTPSEYTMSIQAK
ncbi:MAG TPA: AraC family transcriptional regulator [Firmicutes bacterium]|nr:AraC family transcriptional regulator [Bacillota bacterium]